MDIITTHLNADFDCLGAMVAARKLYPDALMVFPGSQEKSMRDFFLKSTGYLLNFTRLKDIDLSQVARLILVDCQHSSRIGRLAEVAARPDVEVHIYDHHPQAYGDISSTGGVIRDCGSSSAILAGILMEKGIDVNPTEATLMMLGIYEDTGSLTFPSTTVDDYRAAAWLLEHGANLNTVADFITQELTPDQISLLNDLLKSLRTLTVNGVDISLAQASSDYYIGDVAVLAHMMRDMENLDALFLAVDMGRNVYMVGRSRIPEVDAGDILRAFGGGGHATAASASVTDLSLIQVMEKLEELLRARVNPRRTAHDLMSAPVKTVPANTTIAEAGELLTRYNVNAMPVMSGEGRMLGIISRRIVQKAVFHGLGGLPVSEYMHTEFLEATPDTPISVVQDYIIGHNRRFVPIFEQGELVGVITRTDLLRYMYAGPQGGQDEAGDLDLEKVAMRSREVASLMEKHLESRIFCMLRDLGKVGDELELQVYAVGGFVRDLLLAVGNLDIDVTVEGDGVLFAETFAREYGCRVKSHEKFGTAVIIFADGFKIDVASTRLEYYSSPGALPTVERSSLKLDLYRRDFTINTLAISLNPSRFGVLTDYFGAQRDLSEGVIRVLHNLSFVEDPTRVFRAIRFEQRLGFRIAKHTEKLIKNAVKMDFLEKLGGKRLLAELVHIFREKEPMKAVERMARFGLLRYIHADLRLEQETGRVLEEAKSVITWFELLFLERPCEKWAVYFLALCTTLNSDQFWGTCTRLSVSEHYKEKLSESRVLGESVLEKMEHTALRRAQAPQSDIYLWLKPFPSEVLLYMMAKSRSEEVKRYISLYFTRLQSVHCLITGEDLKEMGAPPGPRYKEILDKVLAAKLNNLAHTREDELIIARREAGLV